MNVPDTGWTAVVTGQWNRAILTPRWIGKNLFKVEDGVAVEVAVPLDQYGPYYVQHQEMSVAASNDRISVFSSKKSFEALAQAASIAARAISELPKTPLSAAGINCKYQFSSPTGNLAEITSVASDNRLVDAGFDISHRSCFRALDWKTGFINLTVEQSADDSYSVALNFHLDDQSKHATERLIEWLNTPANEIKHAVHQILQTYICLSDLESLYEQAE